MHIPQRPVVDPRLAFLGGGGEMGERLRAHPWRETPLGDPAGWSAPLKALVGLMLASPQPMFIAWGAAQTWLYNSAFIPIMGDKHPRQLGQPALANVWREAREVLDPLFARVFAGEPVHMQDFGLMLERQGRLEEAHFAFSYIPVRDDAGGVAGLFGACIEITEQVLAARRREAAQERQRRMFEQAPSFVCILHGPEHVFEFVNNAHKKLFNSADWIGKPVREAFPDLAGQGYFERLDEVYRSGRRYVASSAPVRYRRLPGGAVEERLLDFIYEPVLDDAGSVIGIFCEGLDVTEARLAEQSLREAHAQLQEADRRKDAFLATLAHELRNPLAPILQAARIARTPGATVSELRWCAEVIERQGSHMALLLDDLLEVSRITHGKLQLRKARAPLAGIVAAAVEAAHPLLDARGHRLQLRLPEPTPLVEADVLRLSQTLSNLLTNAARYTDPGGDVVLAAHAEGSALHLSVRDTGMGIAPEMLPRLFEAFSQSPAARDRAAGGLGIGLALVKGIVELHGGSVAANSLGPGRGSEFSIVLPGAVIDAAAPVPARPRAGPARPRRILIADDHRDGAESLALLLRLEGHEVRVVHGGREALAAFEGAAPEVMLVDIGMPGFGGHEVARAIRARPEGGQVRLVAITGWGQAEDRARALEAGFDAHVTKPVSMDILAALLSDPQQAAQSQA